jgi:hypothetical protein
VLNATVKNLTVEGSVNITDSGQFRYGAGIVGRAEDSDIVNCINRASITGQNALGGIAVWTYNTPDAIGIHHCLNYGAITNNGEVTPFQPGGVGGIAAGATKITNSANYGAINAIGEAWNSGFLGGIVGFGITLLDRDPFLIVEGCYNAGNLSGYAFYMNGILGMSYGFPITIANCYNTGNIRNDSTPVGTRNNDPSTAGITYSVAAQSLVRYCYNTGSLAVTTHYDSQPRIQDIATTGFTANITDNGIEAAASSPAYYPGFLPPILKWQTANPAYLVDFVGGIASVTNAADEVVAAETEGVNAGKYVLLPGTYSYTGSNGAVGSFTVVDGPKTIALASTVTFTNLAAQGASVVVTNSEGAVQSGNDGVYTLPNGSYTYDYLLGGVVQDSGSFTLIGLDRTIVAPVLAGRVEVSFVVTPEGATVIVKDAEGVAVSPKAGSVLTYQLYEGQAYTYTASAQYHSSKIVAFTAAATTIEVELERLSSTVSISVTPAGVVPTVILTDSGGAVIEPITEGGTTFVLTQGYVYSYSVNAPNAKEATGTFTVNADPQTVSVVLEAQDGKYLPGWDGARPSFGIWVVDPDGGEPVQLGSWDYDADLATYVDSQGAQAPFIQTFDTPLVYSGIDMFPAARLGVATRGITYADLIGWYNIAAEDAGLETITPDTYADFVALASTNSGASEDPYTSNIASHPGTWALPAFFDGYTGTQRSYYPSWLYGVNSGASIRAKGLGAPSPVQSVIALESYDVRVSTLPATVLGSNGEIDDQAELDAAVAYLTQSADTQRAMRNLEGMTSNIFSLDPGAPGARPLGGDGSYYIGSVWITLPSDGIPAGGDGGGKVGLPGSGDLDGDGSTTLDEALLLVQIINDDASDTLSAGQFVAMDINGDGYLTMADVLLVVQIVLRL